MNQLDELREQLAIIQSELEDNYLEYVALEEQRLVLVEKIQFLEKRETE